MIPLVKKHSEGVNQFFSGGFAAGGAAAVYSARSDGNMSLVYGETAGAVENRRRFLGSYGIDSRHLVCCVQIHGDNVCRVTLHDRSRGALEAQSALPGSDALITDRPRLPLAVFSADCPTIFLFDPVSKALGLIHAGWRSTRKRIVSRTIEALRKNYKTEPADLLAGFGPAIRGCCYEVSKEMSACFPGEIEERNGRYFLDLVKVNADELSSNGVGKERIFDSRLCTHCLAGTFFSHRFSNQAQSVDSKQDTGRMISVIMRLCG